MSEPTSNQTNHTVWFQLFKHSGEGGGLLEAAGSSVEIDPSPKNVSALITAVKKKWKNELEYCDEGKLQVYKPEEAVPTSTDATARQPVVPGTAVQIPDRKRLLQTWDPVPTDTKGWEPLMVTAPEQPQQEEIRAMDELLRAKDEEHSKQLLAKDEKLLAKDEELRAKDEKLLAKDEELRAKDEEHSKQMQAKEEAHIKRILLSERLEQYSIEKVYTNEKVHVAPPFKFNKLVCPSIGHERKSGKPILDTKLESMSEVFGNAEDVVIPIYELDSASGNKYLLRSGYSKDFPLTYSNEVDVQTFCETMVEDAFRCLGLKDALNCHREKSLYGYTPDIIVVTVRGKMVFVIEVKSPEHQDGDVFQNGLVGGQIFLYLMTMKQLGVKKPMGAIMTFNKFQIVTLEDFVDKRAVVESREELRTDTVTAQELPDVPKKKETSPVKEPIKFGDVVPKYNRGLKDDEDVDRRIFRSKVYKAGEVFPMLLLALRTAFATCIREKLVLSKLPFVDAGDDLSGRLLFRVSEESGKFVYSSKELTAKLGKLHSANTEFYMLTHLGSGASGDVHLACNRAGTLVCAKFYSYRKSQAATAEERTKENDERAEEVKKVRDREYMIWQKLYSDFGPDETRPIQLQGSPVLLMPYGKEILSFQERKACLGPIKELLRAFADKGYWYPGHDLRWSHVVLIKGKVHLVDLGSLEEIEENSSKDMIESVVQEQMKRLRDRMGSGTSEEASVAHETPGRGNGRTRKATGGNTRASRKRRTS